MKSQADSGLTQLPDELTFLDIATEFFPALWFKQGCGVFFSSKGYESTHN